MSGSEVVRWNGLYGSTSFARTGTVGQGVAEPVPSAVYNGQKAATFTLSEPRYSSEQPASFWDFIFAAAGCSVLCVNGQPTPQSGVGNVSLMFGVQGTQRYQYTNGVTGNGNDYRAELFANGLGATLRNFGGANPVQRAMLSTMAASGPQPRQKMRVNNFSPLSSNYTAPAPAVAGTTMCLGHQPGNSVFRWVGTWAETIWWGHVLSASEIAMVQDYVNARYGAGVVWS